MVEGAVRPCGPSHRGYAGGEQERPGDPQDRAHRGGQGLRRSVKLFLNVQPWCPHFIGLGFSCDHEKCIWYSLLYVSLLEYVSVCWLWSLPSLLSDPEKRGLMYMETSALDSTNVEAAFSEVLTGTGAQSKHTYLSSARFLWFTRRCVFLISSDP